MSGFQEGHELDARAWPTTPAPEVDFFPPPPPPLPEPPLLGVYTDPNLQFRAGVMPGTDTVQAMTAMNGVLQREAWAADEARRQAERANTHPNASPASLPPRSTPRPRPAPAPAAAPQPQAYDLCCQSTRQGLQALQEQLLERRTERRQGARRTARLGAGLFGLAVVWMLLSPALAGWIGALLRHQGALLILGWVLMGLAAAFGLRALWQGLRRSPAEQATATVLACWQLVLPDSEALLGPDQAEALCVAAQLRGVRLQVRFFKWQVPAHRVGTPPPGQNGFVLESEHCRLGLAPAPQHASEVSRHPRESIANRAFRMLEGD